MFIDPVSVLMALVCVVVCFSLPVGTTLFIMGKMGLFKQVKRELESRKFEGESKHE